jgi:hypothetical protein
MFPSIVPTAASPPWQEKPVGSAAAARGAKRKIDLISLFLTNH